MIAFRARITGKFPGYLSPSAGLKFADVPNGLAAISKVPAAGWGQILAYMAFCEVSQDQSPGTPAAAGDFGFKVLTSSDPAEKTKKLSAELANGQTRDDGHHRNVLPGIKRMIAHVCCHVATHVTHSKSCRQRLQCCMFPNMPSQLSRPHAANAKSTMYAVGCWQDS